MAARDDARPGAARLQLLARHMQPAEPQLGAPGAAAVTAAAAAAVSGAEATGPDAGHAALERLFVEFRREMFGPKIPEKDLGRAHPTGGEVVAAPDFSERAMAAEFAQLKAFQTRLLAVGVALAGWAVEELVDYHLVRAEMNGLEFRHRVLRPWAKDPGHYNELVVRKNDEFCIKNEKLCIKNEDFCIKNEELCI